MMAAAVTMAVAATDLRPRSGFINAKALLCLV